jgi:uncharacterized protein
VTAPASEVAIIFLAGFAAGTINSVAGGGTLLSFPVLLWLGRDPIVANVSNAVALWPGSLASAIAFRRELTGRRRWLVLMLLPSVLGAVTGAWLLLATPTRWFSKLVPILILVATLLVALRRPILAGFAAAFPRRDDASANARVFPLVVGQLLVATYGGYFGAAMGIVMLAAYGLAGLGDIHERNAIKNAASAVINAVAAAFFAWRAAVNWGDAAALGVGAVAGGYVGGVVGRRLDPRIAEGLVVVIGVGAAVAQIVRSW